MLNINIYQQLNSKCGNKMSFLNKYVQLTDATIEFTQ